MMDAVVVAVAISIHFALDVKKATKENVLFVRLNYMQNYVIL